MPVTTKKIDQFDINEKINDDLLKNDDNHKRFIFLCISILLTALVLCLTFLYIVKIDSSALLEAIKLCFSNHRYLWFIPLIFFILFRTFFNYFQFTIKAKKYGVNLTLWDKVSFGTIMSFLFCVTPANLFTDPFAIYFFKKHGLEMYKSVVLTLCCSLLWQLAQIAVTLPSFICLCLRYQELQLDVIALGAFWAMTIGFLINIFNVFFLVFSGLNAHFQIFVSLLFNKILKFFRFKYKTKQEIINKYSYNKQMKIEFASFLKEWKISVWLFAFYCFYEIFLYINIWVSLLLITSPDVYIDPLWSFNSGNVAITANKFIPLPGGEGSIEFFLKTILNLKDVIRNIDRKEVETIVDNGILVWRFFTAYIPAFLGIFGFLHYSFNKNKKLV